MSTSLIETPHQGICPMGWHIPTIQEALELKYYVDGNNGSEDNSLSLKSKRWQGSDRFGFAALPAGGFNDNRDYKSSDNQGRFVSGFADFWTVTETTDSTSQYFYLNSTADILIGILKKIFI